MTLQTNPAERREMVQAISERLGSPAVTSRGFGEPEMLHIAEFIWQTATDFENKAEEILKRKGITIISKVTGLFLSAFAAQMIFQGIRNLLFPVHRLRRLRAEMSWPTEP